MITKMITNLFVPTVEKNTSFAVVYLGIKNAYFLIDEDDEIIEKSRKKVAIVKQDGMIGETLKSLTQTLAQQGFFH